MRIIHEIDAMKEAALESRRRGLRTALVPTMGALHAGHLSLVRVARAHSDRVVMSIFLNRAQFGPGEDADAYPQTFDADCRAAREAGVDTVFAPRADAMYPGGYQTWIDVEELSRPLCGAHRPGHFRAVATVVTRLFTIVQPGAAVFGWKDAQQFILLGRLVRDLNLPVEMIGADIVREPDGLAISSRNLYLSEEERRAAPALICALRAIEQAAAGQTDAAALIEIGRAAIVRDPRIRLQYLEIVSLDRLEPLAAVQPGNTLVAVAAFLGETRLIDNIRL